MPIVTTRLPFHAHVCLLSLTRHHEKHSKHVMQYFMAILLHKTNFLLKFRAKESPNTNQIRKIPKSKVAI